MRGLDEPESFVNLFVLWKGSSSSFSGLVPDEGLMIPDILYLESALYIVNRFLCLRHCDAVAVYESRRSEAKTDEHRNNLKISFLIRKFQKFIFVNLLIAP